MSNEEVKLNSKLEDLENSIKDCSEKIIKALCVHSIFTHFKSEIIYDIGIANNILTGIKISHISLNRLIKQVNTCSGLKDITSAIDTINSDCEKLIKYKLKDMNELQDQMYKEIVETYLEGESKSYLFAIPKQKDHKEPPLDAIEESTIPFFKRVNNLRLDAQKYVIFTIKKRVNACRCKASDRLKKVKQCSTGLLQHFGTLKKKIAQGYANIREK